MSEAAGSPFTYSAFISYSRKDSPFALWLHRKLESFRFPAYDGRTLTRNRQHPLSPAFRDLDELPASGDLGGSIRAALEASGSLVVICSPDAARSHWVNKEVEHYLALGRHDRILPVLVSGDPVIAEPGAPATAAFPPAFKDDPSEALWIDARGVESRDRVFARIAAGLLGVSFDQIWKRQQRAARTAALLTTAAAIVVGVPLVAFGWFSSQPLMMNDCPVDKLTFASGWGKATEEGDRLRVARVGQNLWMLCPDGDQPWTPALARDTACRGPYGDTVLDGAIRLSGEEAPVTDMVISYHMEPGAPCCYWAIHTPDTIREVYDDPNFRWLKPGEAPRLYEMPFNEIDVDRYTRIETDRHVEDMSLAAVECRIGIWGRMQMTAIRIADWFTPEPSAEEIQEKMERDQEKYEGRESKPEIVIEDEPARPN